MAKPSEQNGSLKLKILKYIFLLSPVLLLLPSLVLAAPIISSFSGNLNNDSTITVQGSGFGAKSITRPLFFDNFDSNDSGRQNGNTIPTKNASHYGVWSFSSGAEIPTYSNANQRGVSTLSSYVHFWAEKYHNSGFIQVNFSETHVPILMFSYWIRISYANVSGGGNVKVTKLLDTSGQYSDTYDSFQDGFDFARAPNEGCIAHWNDMSGNTFGWPGPPPTNLLGYPVPFDNWFQFTAFRKASSDGVADGTEWIIVNGTTLINNNAIQTWGTGKKWARLALGNYIANYTTLDVYLQFDDVYIDNTWQSVWIGNASTWNTSIHREIQIPVTWTDSLISFTANQGSFTNGQTVYLYVVDENGNINENGYPITIGVGQPPDTTPPAAPTGVVVQ